MSKEYSLVVRTDKYTGNIDSFLLGALFGYNDCRYGGAHGTMIFDDLMTEDEKDFFEDTIEDRPNDDYGLQPYKINNDFSDGYNSLEFGICDYRRTDLPRMIEIWRRVYGEEITYRDDIDKREYSIKLFSFHLKTYTITEEIEEIK